MLQKHDGLLLQCLMSECAEALRSWNIMEYHGINLRSIASLCVGSSARCRQPELNAPDGSALKPQQIMAGCHGSECWRWQSVPWTALMSCVSLRWVFALVDSEMCCKQGTKNEKTIHKWTMDHWIGLRQNLQETMVFTIKYRAFL